MSFAANTEDSVKLCLSESPAGRKKKTGACCLRLEVRETQTVVVDRTKQAQTANCLLPQMWLAFEGEDFSCWSFLWFI